MILTIAYEQRFAVGIASMHGMLATVALQQSITFFIVIWIGCLCACFLLGDIRTRSKLIEIGGAMALAMMIATLASGFMGFDPAKFVMENAPLRRARPDWLLDSSCSAFCRSSRRPSASPPA